MADQGQDHGGPNHRRRLNRDDKVFTQANTNRDVKKELDLDQLIAILQKSKRVDQREIQVKRFYEHLPGWVNEQPPQTHGRYRGMRKIIGKMHYNRCRSIHQASSTPLLSPTVCYLNLLLNGRAGSSDCQRIDDELEVAEKEIERLQEEIKALGGRVWKIPQAFGLSLSLLKVD